MPIWLVDRQERNAVARTAGRRPSSVTNAPKIAIASDSMMSARQGMQPKAVPRPAKKLLTVTTTPTRATRLDSTIGK